MQLAYLLFLVTIGQEGDLSTAYSPKEDMVECEAAEDAVKTIFEANDIKIAHISCVQTKHAFTPFRHGVPKDAPRQTYRNQLRNGNLLVWQEEDMAACEAAKGASSETIWCTTSHQKLIE